MGSGNHEVVDISSDEEVESRAEVDYLHWLNDVIDAIEENSDSTDVVEFVSEVRGSVDSPFRKPISSIQPLVDDDDDDDDCLILEGDPDKTAAIDDDEEKLAKNNDDDDDDDDVLVVGQKGEIACRDFPHPRHSCAKYPFGSTSHDKYCDMCHCYVCDIRAPCPYWCLGVSNMDHCHANDKEKIWKNQREYSRTGNMPTTQPSSKPTTSLSMISTVTHQISFSPTQNIIRLSHNTVPRNQVGIRPCSSALRVPNQSNVRARSRIKLPVRPHSHNHVVQSLNSVRNSVIQKDRVSCMSKVRSQVASSGTRSTNGNNIKVGTHTNVQVSQSTQHNSIVPPAINRDLYTQQRCKYQPDVSDRCSAVPGSQSNVHIRHLGRNIGSSVDRQAQTTSDLFVPLETPLTNVDPQAAGGVQQQPRSNENVLQTKLSEFESWLMESSNQAGLVNPLSEPVGQDFVSTFDFETFLDN